MRQDIRGFRRAGAALAAALVATALVGAATPAAADPVAPAVESGATPAPTAAGDGTGTAWGAVPPGRLGTFVRANIEAQEARIGRPLAVVRDYYLWDSVAPSADDQWACAGGRALAWSVRAKTTKGFPIPWSTIATAAPGSPHHNQMTSWARRMAAMPCPVVFIFHHEPESDATRHGTPAEFAAAWRTFVDIVRASGALNVTFTWTMTAWSFDPAATGASSVATSRAATYYPGDAWVDDIGADGYNWLNCKGTNNGWRELATALRWHREFGRLHPTETLAIPEWGTVEDPVDPTRKAGWISRGSQQIKTWTAQGARYRWVAYFDRPYVHTSVCEWQTTTSPGADSAFRSAGQDPFYAPPLR